MSHLTKELLLADFEETGSMTQIAKKHDCSVTTICRKLEEFGLDWKSLRAERKKRITVSQ